MGKFLYVNLIFMLRPINAGGSEYPSSIDSEEFKNYDLGWIPKDTWETELEYKIHSFYEALFENQLMMTRVKVLFEDFIASYLLIESSGSEFQYYIFQKVLFDIIKTSFEDNFDLEKDKLQKILNRMLYLVAKKDTLNAEEIHDLFVNFKNKHWLKTLNLVFNGCSQAQYQLEENITLHPPEIAGYTTNERLELIFSISDEKEEREIQLKNQEEYDQIMNDEDFQIDEHTDSRIKKLKSSKEGMEKINKYILLTSKMIHKKENDAYKEDLKLHAELPVTMSILDKARTIYSKKLNELERI